MTSRTTTMRTTTTRTALAFLGAVAGVVLLAASPVDAAKPPPITGPVACTSSGSVSFSPGLRYKTGIDARGRGPSGATWSASLTGCGDGAGGPAAGGIDHGTFAATDRIAGSYCEKFAASKFVAEITWFDAGGAVVGTTKLKASVGVEAPGFYDPIVVHVSGTAKPASRVDPGGTFTAAYPSSVYWAYSGNCGKAELPSLSLAATTVTLTP